MIWVCASRNSSSFKILPRVCPMRIMLHKTRHPICGPSYWNVPRRVGLKRRAVVVDSSEEVVFFTNVLLRANFATDEIDQVVHAESRVAKYLVGATSDGALKMAVLLLCLHRRHLGSKHVSKPPFGTDYLTSFSLPCPSSSLDVKRSHWDFPFKFYKLQNKGWINSGLKWAVNGYFWPSVINACLFHADWNWGSPY